MIDHIWSTTDNLCLWYVHSVPLQLFVDGKHVGNGEAIIALNESGKLRPMLERFEVQFSVKGSYYYPTHTHIVIYLCILRYFPCTYVHTYFAHYHAYTKHAHTHTYSILPTHTCMLYMHTSTPLPPHTHTTPSTDLYKHSV